MDKYPPKSKTVGPVGFFFVVALTCTCSRSKYLISDQLTLYLIFTFSDPIITDHLAEIQSTDSM